MAARLLQAAQKGCAAQLFAPSSALGRGIATSSIDVPVIIVGAGPTGLTLSKLLSQLGVQSVVLERALTVTQHPQVSLSKQ
jgi:NADPH-dependent glutamate synthase beta subunit-like oxidoreductase